MKTGKGRVYWITGLSGAGKTTVGKHLYGLIKAEKDNVIILDGDILRQVYNDDLGYGKDDRLKGAQRHGRVCKFLADQGLDVICCTISMFDSVRRWNRQNIENYFEVFLDVPLEILQNRDNKGLYDSNGQNSTQNVVGLDLKLDLPRESDMRVVNDGHETPAAIAANIYRQSLAANQ